MPPSLARSNGLLLPNPAQLPSIFRLSATAMAQSQAFPLVDSSSSLSPITEKETIRKSYFPNITTKTTINRSSDVISTQIIQKSSVNPNTEETTSSPYIITENTQTSSISPIESETTITTMITTDDSIILSSLSSSDLAQSQHFSSPTLDFATFLQSVNLSEQYKEEFLRLMESEIARRLERKLNDNQKEEKILDERMAIGVCL